MFLYAHRKDCFAFNKVIKVSQCSINAKANSVQIFSTYLDRTSPSFYLSLSSDWHFICSQVEHESNDWCAKISFEHSVISHQTPVIKGSLELPCAVQ